MSDKNSESLYVRVKDYAGNDFLCPIDALKNPKDVSEDELENCVDDATVHRYSGNIKIAE